MNTEKNLFIANYWWRRKLFDGENQLNNNMDRKSIRPKKKYNDLSYHCFLRRFFSRWMRKPIRPQRSQKSASVELELITTRWTVNVSLCTFHFQFRRFFRRFSLISSEKPDCFNNIWSKLFLLHVSIPFFECDSTKWAAVD